MAQYAGFWIRVAAYIIDYIIVSVATYAIVFILALATGLQTQSAGATGEEAAVIAGLVMFLVVFVGQWLYYAMMESSSLQGTLGKKAVGIAVTDESGRRIGFGRATGRYFAKIISGLILLFGYFMIGWTQRKQGLHDMIAGTLVYYSRGGQNLTTSAEVFE
jgi:uncharacterized RDD family membrane protein YckC